MTRIYRILRRPYAKNPLDGEGAYRLGGRWSSPGVRLAYTAEHLSLAMIEYLVHIEAQHAPKDLVVVAAAIPAGVSRFAIAEKRLPPIGGGVRLRQTSPRLAMPSRKSGGQLF